MVSVLVQEFGISTSMNLKFYTSVAKELKLKVRTFWGIILKFLEVTRKKLVGVLFSFFKHPGRLFIFKDVAPIGEELLKKRLLKTL